MTTSEIATRLVELCRKGDFEAAQKELFAPNAISIEPFDTPPFEKETRGLDAISEKGRKFNDLVETLHGLEISEPLVAGNSIAFTMRMDITMKGKERGTFDELCIYQVRDGKVISEQFYV